MTARPQSDPRLGRKRQPLQTKLGVIRQAHTGLYFEGEAYLGRWSLPLKSFDSAGETVMAFLEFPPLSDSQNERVSKDRRTKTERVPSSGVPQAIAVSVQAAASRNSSDCSGSSALAPDSSHATMTSNANTRMDSDSSASLEEISWPSLTAVASQLPSQPPMKKRDVKRHTTVTQPKLERLTAIPPMWTNGEAVYRAPLSVMISTDFVVSSPVKDNLLLTIALQQHSGGMEADAKGRAESESMRGKILRGVFIASSPFARFSLGPHATRVATEPNAGGASVVSEALSVEYFVRRFGATNVVSEMEVEYLNPNWKKVDYICDIYGQRIGVSVTRAMSYPDPWLFSAERAISLLRKKLHGLTVARSGVSQRHSFVKALLHVWCETVRTAELMHSQFAAIAREMDVEEDVIMVLTVAEGKHGKPIFYESLCNDPAVRTASSDHKYQRYPFWWVRVKSFAKKISTKVHAV